MINFKKNNKYQSKSQKATLVYVVTKFAKTVNKIWRDKNFSEFHLTKEINLIGNLKNADKILRMNSILQKLSK